MTLIDLLKVYRCYNDLEIIVVDKDYNDIKTLAGNSVYDNQNGLLDMKVLAMRAIPYQSEENAYFMENEMRMTVRAKVKVWVRQAL